MNKKKKFNILQVARLLLQITFFIFLPALYMSAFNGVKVLTLAVIHQQFSASLLPQLIEVLATIPVTVILGRFFCGWMCAFGAYGDFITRISGKLFRKKWRINEKADAWLKYLKYVVLAVLVVVEWIFGSAVFSSANPWDVFGLIATVGKAPAFSYAITSLTAGFVIFAAISIASVFIERFFCRYLCPMGAIFAIASKLRIVKIKKPTANCGKCRVCTNACAMGIPLYKMETVKSGDCINCMKCVSACPRKNAALTVANSDVRPLLAGAAAAGVITGIYYSNSFLINSAGAGSQFVAQEADTGNQSGETVSIIETTSEPAAAVSSVVEETTAKTQTTTEKETTKKAETTTAVSGKYKDGTYQGSGTGFRGGTTTVTVTVKNGKITDITVNSYSDDYPFFNRAFPTVTSEIIGSQSTNVDAVAGATYSSLGIMEAVANALS